MAMNFFQKLKKQTVWPDREERSLVGRFYLSGLLSEALNVIVPFEFIYLYLLMERPEWAVIPLLVETAAVLVMEIPTGAVADRWGRKVSVITGDLLSTASWALIPLSASLQGNSQVLAVSTCFMIDGLGQTMVSGAEEAWVVDNLAAARRKDLIDRYFARILSFGSIGGIIAGSLALLLLVFSSVHRGTLNLLWYVAAFGQAVSVGIALTIPEHQGNDQEPDDDPEDGEDDVPDDIPFLSRVIQGFTTILHRRPLFSFLLAIMVTALAGSITADAFEISLLIRGLDARGLAPLDIMEDLFGMMAPLLGVAMARWLGLTRSLILFVCIPAAAVCLFLFRPGLWPVIGLYLLFNFTDDLWDPVANAHLHALIPSSCRATVGSIFNQASEMVSLAGLGAFALLLGKHSRALQEAAPDLLEAFSGGAATLVEVPRGPGGLPVPDLILVLFTLFGLMAVPFIRRSKITEKPKEET